MLPWPYYILRGVQAQCLARPARKMPSPSLTQSSEQWTFEFWCPHCNEALQISTDAPRKRRRGTYGVSAPPEIRCTCEVCNGVIDLEIPPESGRARDEPEEDLEFEPVTMHPLEGYEHLGPEGGSWCRVRNCTISNHPCKRYEGGVVCFCQAHWNIIRSSERYMDVLRREAVEFLGRPLSF